MVIVVDVDVGSRRRRADGLTSAVSPFTPAPFCPPTHPPRPFPIRPLVGRGFYCFFFFLLPGFLPCGLCAAFVCFAVARVIPRVVAGFYRVLPSFFLGFTGFYRGLQGFT